MTVALEPYFLGLSRAMISLGPLTGGETYCTYKCRFCYVNGPYQKYAARSPDEIMEWLSERREQYDIVYVSGDTDSFARPRTADGLSLLTRLAELDCDVLFTTRYVFSPQECAVLAGLQSRMRGANRLLIPCVSVAQVNHPRLEPPPVPTPEARLDQLKRFHALGFTTILTIRPFIPYLAAGEYADIVHRGADHCDAILGGNWYTDPDGHIDRLTRQALGITRTLIGPNTRTGPLDSTHSRIAWHETCHPEAEMEVGKIAANIGKPFGMRSGPVVDQLRSLPR